MEGKDAEISTVAGGRAPGLFRHLMDRIAENVKDPATDPKAKRKFTLTFTVTPTQNRREARIELSSSIRLAPVEAMEGNLFFAQTKDGLVVSTNDVQQTGIFDGQEEAPADEAVDGRTGEVIPRIGAAK